MPNTFSDTIVILLFTVVPLFLILIHVFLSFGRKWTWSLLIPSLWTALGVWMLITEYLREVRIAPDLIIFFLAGDLVFAGFTVLIRIMKTKHNNAWSNKTEDILD